MKTEVKNTIQDITEYLESLDNNEIVNIHNEYCQEQNYSDDEIYTNDEDFFNTFFEGKVLEAVRAVSFGEFNYSDDFIKFNGYGNLETFNNPVDHIDYPAIAQAIKDGDFCPYDIELIDEEEEETEEED